MSLAPLADWNGTRLGPVAVLSSIDSTNAEALRRIDAGSACDGLVLVAERQDAGRGSRGRSWLHRPGKSLALTALVRWPDPARLHLATWAAVTAVVEVVRSVGLAATIKWPNDALIGGRKVAGVLVEARGPAADAWAAIGIGINVGHDAADFDGDYRLAPTSLRAAGGECDLLAAHRRLLDALDRALAGQTVDGGVATTRAFTAGLGLAGRVVVATRADGTAVEGRLDAITVDGALEIRGTGGTTAVRIPGGHVVALAAAQGR